MGLDQNQQDPVELLLGELRRMEAAGVMRPSPVDPVALLDATGRRPLSRRVRQLRWMAAAAVLLITVSAWSLMFRHQLRTIRSQRDSFMIASASISDCIVGPRGTLPGPCRTYDLDRDGDADLADWQSYQIHFADR